MTRLLGPEDLNHQLRDLPAWQVRDDLLVAAFTAPTFQAGIDLVVAVAAEAEEMDHHPDIDIRWTRIVFALSTHSAGGLTQLDVELAHRIGDAAGRLGADPHPG